MAKRIISEFPEDYGRYVEVFGGGGSVLFAQKNPVSFEVYNDLNSDLVRLFRCIKYHPDELRKEISFYLNSREMFSDCRKRLMNGNDYTDIQRAAMFYLCAVISFGADVRSYGCTKNRIRTDSFSEISERLNGVVIENGNFEKIIRQYDRPEALFYCDPPYHSTEKHYTEVFTENDHLRLNNTLKALKGRFILSYNDDDFIRNLYDDFTIMPAERSNNISKGTFKEVIIKNF